MTRLLARAVMFGVLLAFAMPAAIGADQARAQTASPVEQGGASPMPALPGDENARVETIRLGALDLVARHVRPPGANLATILIVHDTLGAFVDPLIVRLQAALAGKGRASLAINLSLGESGRIGPFDCNAAHRHRHEGALDEIDAWIDWSLGQGLGPIVVAGHGRGGAQAAWHLAARAKGKVSAGVLLAPTGWTPRQADAEYRARFAAGLSALLTRIAGLKPDDAIEGVPFLHCGAANVSQASIKSYYGVEPMRDTPTALAMAKVPTLALMPGPNEAAPEDKTHERLAKLVNPVIAIRTIGDADKQFSDQNAFDTMVDAIDAYLRSIMPETSN